MNQHYIIPSDEPIHSLLNDIHISAYHPLQQNLTYPSNADADKSVVVTHAGSCIESSMVISPKQIAPIDILFSID